MLTTLWRVLPLAPQVREEASSVIQSTRSLTGSHASDTVSVRFAGTSQLSGFSILHRRSDGGKCPTRNKSWSDSSNRHQEIDL